jgi:hypothetical protein
MTGSTGGTAAGDGMGDQAQNNVANGDRCEVIAGTHRGKAGTVEDLKLSKTGHATITVREDNGAN